MTDTDRFKDWTAREILRHVAREQERMMTAIDDLAAAVTNLQAEDSALLTAVNASLTDLAAEVSTLQAASASGDSSQIESAVNSIANVVADLQSVTSRAQAADPGPQSAPAPGSGPPATDSPVDDPGSGLPLYIAPAGDTNVDTTVWTQVPDVTGDNGEALYTFSGDTVGQPPAGVENGWTLFHGTPTPVAPSAPVNAAEQGGSPGAPA